MDDDDAARDGRSRKIAQGEGLSGRVLTHLTGRAEELPYGATYGQGVPRVEGQGQAISGDLGVPRFEGQGHSTMLDQGVPRVEGHGHSFAIDQGVPRFEGQGLVSTFDQGVPRSDGHGHVDSQVSRGSYTRNELTKSRRETNRRLDSKEGRVGHSRRRDHISSDTDSFDGECRRRTHRWRVAREKRRRSPSESDDDCPLYLIMIRVKMLE